MQPTPYRPGRLMGPSLQEIMQAADAECDALASQLERERSYRSFRLDLSHTIPDPVPVVSVGGATICSRGNLSAIVGEAKSKKTFLCSALVGGLLSAAGYMGFDPRPMRVLWIDTEQAEAHVQRVIRRTHAIACLDCCENSEQLVALKLRELAPKRRMDMLVDAMMAHRPDLLVIDGVSDLQYNTNDLEESERIITQLMKFSSSLDMHILCVLHTNPNSDKARGHLGSALQRKAETVLYVHRVGDVSVVEPQFCRNEPFERFAFRIDAQGLPQSCELPVPPQREDSCLRLLCDEFGGAVERSVLTERLARTEGISLQNARVRISRALKSGSIRTSEEGRVIIQN